MVAGFCAITVSSQDSEVATACQIQVFRLLNTVHALDILLIHTHTSTKRCLINIWPPIFIPNSFTISSSRSRKDSPVNLFSEKFDKRASTSLSTGKIGENLPPIFLQSNSPTPRTCSHSNSTSVFIPR